MNKKENTCGIYNEAAAYALSTLHRGAVNNEVVANQEKIAGIDTLLEDGQKGMPTREKKRRRGRPKGRKTTSHPKLDRPKRPLSAYNLFFRDERMKIAREEEQGRHQLNQLLPEKTVPTADSGKIKFAALGKKIGERWKSLEDEAKKAYVARAEVEMSKWRKAMDVYEKKVKELDELEKLEKQEEAALMVPPMFSSSSETYNTNNEIKTTLVAPRELLKNIDTYPDEVHKEQYNQVTKKRKSLPLRKREFVNDEVDAVSEARGKLQRKGALLKYLGNASEVASLALLSNTEASVNAATTVRHCQPSSGVSAIAVRHLLQAKQQSREQGILDNIIKRAMEFEVAKHLMEETQEQIKQHAAFEATILAHRQRLVEERQSQTINLMMQLQQQRERQRRVPGVPYLDFQKTYFDF